MKFKLIPFFVYIFLTSCSQQKKIISSDKFDNRIVIINSSENIKWISKKAYKPWNPNKSELNIIDSVLEKAVIDKRSLFLKQQSLKELKERYMQYLCYINDDGDKIVYINSFCKVPTIYHNGKEKLLDWQNEMIDIADGGSCYWNIKINISTQSYFELMINGES
ncbi:hypothetical protein SAMN05444671_3853 [Flavobacterium sp. CF108]|uniref:hypothetical protein n=1 Tax=unclassified Flavobacterium TaxID=196869 RepID=UPI0008D6764F|nr:MULTISPECIES: hypothetical protein [unclassified Flavobacterium]SEO96834.1 hypothetical protein SAMN04487978_4118 [Flavobacterium sp. fv08]SHH81096.1 hypothetical protein SAMN05444671_3853 [Flavobacterium sp. CF108]